MALRSDLVGRSNEPLPARVARARALLEAAVDPGWRRDVRIPLGRGRFARPGSVTGCRRDALNRREVVQAGGQETGVEQELCSGHCRRWILHGRPSLATFIATTKPKIVDYEQPQRCGVASCRVGRSGGWLCPQHRRAWISVGEPPVRDWVASAAVTEPQGAVCTVRRCPLVAAPGADYCRAHRSRWIRLEPVPWIMEQGRVARSGSMQRR
ncbi:hypothetical protein, partial [Pseudonocardia sp. GCM10023141]|uniref:hypothetical protein n=1 Tax=Pseudonocardia sp. GCM10023141 TaxID=3252653 RepID=UPI00360FF25E